MIYYLFQDTFNIVQYISFRASGAAITALTISFLIGPKIIRTLVKNHYGETIRKTGPVSHLKKEGTPSMGGIIIILSITSLIIKLLYWFSIRKTLSKIKSIDKQKFFLFRLAFCMLTYITPVYSIIQQPNLVVSHYVSTITFLIVIVLAILGMIIERWLFYLELEQNVNLYDKSNAI